VRTPWRPVYHVIFAACAGVIGESIIIDIDHWRHYFLGALWGLMAATNRAVAAAPADMPSSQRRGPISCSRCRLIDGLAQRAGPA
jgi:hypothetical protein